MSHDTEPWALHADDDEPKRLVAAGRVWEHDTALLVPAKPARHHRVLADQLAFDEAIRPPSPDDVVFAVAATRIIDALDRDPLVAALEASVIPLPHQLYALERALSGEGVRYLLADEVGLGKTIEAGLILRELKVRGLARRILVVAPAGLTGQWVSELQTHFQETFRRVEPAHFGAWRQLLGVDDDVNLWHVHDQVVCSLDTVKPIDARRGWSRDQLLRYNRERFEDLVAAQWDLVIFDEAHRLGGSTDQVARSKLGEALSQACPYLLLLSATPHQGKTDAFRRLFGFLDPDALPDDSAVTRDNVAPYVIRTEKRFAIDADGKPLFQPRRTQIVAVAWDDGRQEQRVLYEAVTDYVREGYNQAMREKRTAIGLLMILMQRLVTSSTAAIRTALERRLQVLELPQGQLSLFEEDIGESWVDLDGQEQMESILRTRLQGLKNERREVELLLSAARRCEARAPDCKAEALLRWIHDLRSEEGDQRLKVLVFTEFVPTQSMLATFLRDRGFPVVVLNGSMNLAARKEVQEAFAGEAQILISTDAGGEGLNLQFCHVVVNYDLPWNPMKLEQRIGRVDRIGQRHVVRALNFALDGTVELRVREVLEEKLQRILEEFGVDKLSDVLDSEEGDVDFESLYVEALRDPQSALRRANDLVEQLRQRAGEVQRGTSVLGRHEKFDPAAARRLQEHQLPFWTEQMTLAWLRSRRHRGAEVRSQGNGAFDLVWPDGTTWAGVHFRRSAATDPSMRSLTLEEPRVRSLLDEVVEQAPVRPIARARVEGVSDKVAGLWTLWQVGMTTSRGRRCRAIAVFDAEDGRRLGPTARLLWDRLLVPDTGIQWLDAAQREPEQRQALLARARESAELAGAATWHELESGHQERLAADDRKVTAAFAARKRAIDRLGLEQVRAHRLAALQRETHDWQAGGGARSSAVPDLTLVAAVEVVADAAEA